MIDFVRGKVAGRSDGRLVVDVGGIGFSVDVPSSLAAAAPSAGAEVTLRTELLVREDAMQLVGFADESQRQMFRALTSVSGIGPKVALRILGEMETGELAGAIVRGDIGRLIKLPGVGRKTAEVLVAHLRDAMGGGTRRSGRAPATAVVPPPLPAYASAGGREDSVRALCALGLEASRAAAAVDRALADGIDGSDASRLVAEALRRN